MSDPFDYRVCPVCNCWYVEGRPCNCIALGIEADATTAAPAAATTDKPVSVEQLKEISEEFDRIAARQNLAMGEALLAAGFTLICCDLLRDHQVLVSRNIFEKVRKGWEEQNRANPTKPTPDQV